MHVAERLRAISPRVLREVALGAGATVALSALVIALGAVLAGIVAFSGSWPGVLPGAGGETALAAPAADRVDRQVVRAARRSSSPTRIAVPVALRRTGAPVPRPLPAASTARRRTTWHKPAARKRATTPAPSTPQSTASPHAQPPAPSQPAAHAQRSPSPSPASEEPTTAASTTGPTTRRVRISWPAESDDSRGERRDGAARGWRRQSPAAAPVEAQAPAVPQRPAAPATPQPVPQPQPEAPGGPSRREHPHGSDRGRR